MRLVLLLKPPDFRMPIAIREDDKNEIDAEVICMAYMI